MTEANAQREADKDLAMLAALSPYPWVLMPKRCGPDGQGVFTADMGPICEVGDPYPRGDNHPQENMAFIAVAPVMCEYWIRRALAPPLDLPRLTAWASDPARKPAALAFTSGVERQVADLIEAERATAEARVGDLDVDAIATATADKFFDESDDDFFEQFDGEGRYRTTWTKDDFVAELRSILESSLHQAEEKGAQ
jgi:hypothetical protein